MPKPFNEYDYITIGDMERCPFSYRTKPEAYIEWVDADDQRLKLLALDRYADEISQRK